MRRRVVSQAIFRYATVVNRTSLLDSLRELRRRKREAGELRLASSARQEALARAREQRAKALLAREEERRARALAVERDRLADTGIRASEGHQRLLWERATRLRAHALAEAAEAAERSHQEAAKDCEAARVAVHQAQAELEQVQSRIERQASELRAKQEQSRQEAQDESSLRRFFGQRPT